jgi:hypothetical protein
MDMDAVAGADGYHKPPSFYCKAACSTNCQIATFMKLWIANNFVEKNLIIYLAIAASIALILLFTGVCSFANSDTKIVQAQMMPSGMPTPTSTASPSSDQSVVIFFVVIAVVAVALIAVVLYLVYSRKLKKEMQSKTRHVYSSRSLETSPLQPLQSAAKEPAKPFQAFICYKKSSGKDYADHLKSGLEEVGVHTFEDCRDIPQTVVTEEGWAQCRDKALTESKYFLLIMTPGFDLSSEVIKEIAMARKQSNKTFIFFRHRSMGRKILVNLGDEVLDIGRLEQVSFESKEELLRLAINILLKGGAK